jgi:hypothetical protein
MLLGALAGRSVRPGGAPDRLRPVDRGAARCRPGRARARSRRTARATRLHRAADPDACIRHPCRSRSGCTPGSSCWLSTGWRRQAGGRAGTKRLPRLALGNPRAPPSSDSAAAERRDFARSLDSRPRLLGLKGVSPGRSYGRSMIAMIHRVPRFRRGCFRPAPCWLRIGGQGRSARCSPGRSCSRSPPRASPSASRVVSWVVGQTARPTMRLSPRPNRANRNRL